MQGKRIDCLVAGIVLVALGCGKDVEKNGGDPDGGEESSIPSDTGGDGVNGSGDSSGENATTNSTASSRDDTSATDDGDSASDESTAGTTSGTTAGTEEGTDLTGTEQPGTEEGTATAGTGTGDVDDSEGSEETEDSALGASDTGQGDATDGDDTSLFTDTEPNLNTETDTEVDTGAELPGSAICANPLSLPDTSSPDHTIGSGTPDSCTFQDLRDAVSQGGVIVFDCGDAAHTINVTEGMVLPTNVNTIIDGEGLITLDGGRTSGRQNRILEFNSPDFRATDTTVVLQGLRFVNAEAPAEDYIAENGNNPACAYGYADGQGGAVFIRDGRLRVIDCVFEGNWAADIGPDTGGGAIYAIGCNELTVVGSTFSNNRGSNSGAIGLLHTEGTFVNSVFEGSQATGVGQNYAGGDADGCPGVGHENQGGAGGNGGAMAIDGGAEDHNSFCGCVFDGNSANELGTIFRTPNSAKSPITFEQCTFNNNYAGAGGGGMYVQDVSLTIIQSTFSGNWADGGGGAIRVEQGSYGSDMLLENSTLINNYVNESLAGALSFSCGDWDPLPPCDQGAIRNVTFYGNEARGGEGYFAAAILNHGERRTLSAYNTIFQDNIDNHEWTPMACSIRSTGDVGMLPGENNFQWPMIRIGDNNQEDNPCAEDTTWADTTFGVLQDNGGPTLTVIPDAQSEVIGAGSDCPSVDQRGEPRPEQECTAGAVEP